MSTNYSYQVSGYGGLLFGLLVLTVVVALPMKIGARLVNAAFDQLDRLAQKIDPEKPWAYPDAERLDAMTFAEWMRQNVAHENARRLVAFEMSSVACASPELIAKVRDKFAAVLAKL